jgi:hypothetical protein
MKRLAVTLLAAALLAAVGASTGSPASADLSPTGIIDGH